jgi:hypothetical protein
MASLLATRTLTQTDPIPEPRRRVQRPLHIQLGMRAVTHPMSPLGQSRRPALEPVTALAAVDEVPAPLGRGRIVARFTEDAVTSCGPTDQTVASPGEDPVIPTEPTDHVSAWVPLS